MQVLQQIGWGSPARSDAVHRAFGFRQHVCDAPMVFQFLNSKMSDEGTVMRCVTRWINNIHAFKEVEVRYASVQIVELFDFLGVVCVSSGLCT